MKRKLMSTLLSAALLVSCIITPTHALTASPNYIPGSPAPRAISYSKFRAGLEISNGLASCTGSIEIVPGCTATLTMELYRDDDSIKTWKAENAARIIELSKSYFITTGHTYQVIVSVDVYNSSGKLIEHATKESDQVKY